MTKYEDFMHEAYNEAVKAKNIGEVPVGAVFVLDGEIIARGHNRSIIDNDTTAHAEMNALRDAGKFVQNYRLNGVEVYTTLEPCPMCAFALVMARVKKVVFAAKDTKFGSFGTVFDFANNQDGKFNHKIEIISGVMEKECSDILKTFFLEKRNKSACHSGQSEESKQN